MLEFRRLNINAISHLFDVTSPATARPPRFGEHGRGLATYSPSGVPSEDAISNDVCGSTDGPNTEDAARLAWNKRHLTYLMKQNTPEGVEFCRGFPRLKILDLPTFLREIGQAAP